MEKKLTTTQGTTPRRHSPDISTAILIIYHRITCQRPHYPNYPAWLVDNFGHWRG